MKNTLSHFLIQVNDIAPKEIIPGYFARIVHGDNSTTVYWEIKKGHSMPEHHHRHEQVTYIVEGHLEMTIGGELYSFGPGNTHVIRSDTPHGAIALTDCRVIDFFTPLREDYL